MSKDSIEGLRAKIDQFHTLNNNIKALELETETKLEPMKKLKEQIAGEIMEVMQALDIERFDGSIGKVSLLTMDYVNMPQGEDNKQKFFDHLKAEGIFEETVSVHYQKLQSYYKNKLEEAVEKQEPLNIPGLEPKQRRELRPYKL